MKRAARIAGCGAVCCAGSGVEPLWSSLLEGRSGIRRPAGYDTAGFPGRVVGQVALGDDGDLPRNAVLLERALAEALADCGWRRADGRLGPPPGDAQPERRGLYFAIRPEEDEAYVVHASDNPPGSVFDGSAIRELARSLELRGPWLELHDACSTGAALLGEAFHDLRHGAADLAVVLAANADVTLETLCHYALLKAISPHDGPDACRPFDARRDGFVRAEGAACVVLVAEPAHAANGGPTVRGYGSSSDAHRLTAGHPEERGLVLAVERCLRDAGVEPDAVDHVNAHGTGTPMNDLHEARALHRVFGPRAAEIPLTANKAVTGHASFASGLIEAIVTARTLETGLVPPIAHLEALDPGLPPLDAVIGQPRPASPACALSISSAFGGLNVALLLAR